MNSKKKSVKKLSKKVGVAIMRILIDLDEATRVINLSKPFFTIHVNDLVCTSTIGNIIVSESFEFSDTSLFFDLAGNDWKTFRLTLHDGENRLDWDGKQYSYGSCDLCIQAWFPKIINTNLSISLPLSSNSGTMVALVHLVIRIEDDNVGSSTAIKHSWRAPSIQASITSARFLPDLRIAQDSQSIGSDNTFAFDLEYQDTFVQAYVGK